MPRGALPTFLVIGAGKCGTTSLHQYLGEHPEIWMSRVKELCFFQVQGDASVYSAPLDPLLEESITVRRNWHRGVDWYREQFDPAYRVRGESSPGYTSPHQQGVAERAASVVPDAKLIFCVREPVERALSTYRFRRADGTERRPLAEALQPDSYYSRTSCYAACLEPFVERFGRDRILIVEAERLDHDRRAALREVFDFLEVDPDFSSPAFERRWNVTAEQGGLRWRTLARLRRTEWWPKLAHRVPRRALWLTQLAATGSPAAEAADPPAVGEPFVAELREDAARFRELVGMDFAHWSL